MKFRIIWVMRAQILSIGGKMMKNELSMRILVQNEQNKAFILEMTLIFVEKEYKGTLFIRYVPFNSHWK